MKNNINELRWDSYYDDDNNTYWEAPALGDEQGGVYSYRIRQRLFGDKIVYIEDSDDDLLMDIHEIINWSSLEDAKNEINKHFRNLIKNL